MFSAKRLDLSRIIKIGRKVPPKHIPKPSNGIFDAKVLSRHHADIWCEGGKVWIRDVGSSNGTYVNEVRLCEENVRGEPFLLQDGDEIVFGIDIEDEMIDATAELEQLKSKLDSLDALASMRPLLETNSASGVGALSLPVSNQSLALESALETQRRALSDALTAVSNDARTARQELEVERRNLEEEKRRSEALSDKVTELESEIRRLADMARITAEVAEEKEKLKEEEVAGLRAELESRISQAAAAERLVIESNSITLETETRAKEAAQRALDADATASSLSARLEQSERNFRTVQTQMDELKGHLNEADLKANAAEKELEELKK
ncbi:hypothetical protein HK405_014895, partial [Cladochytrium tenue]